MNKNENYETHHYRVMAVKKIFHYKRSISLLRNRFFYRLPIEWYSILLFTSDSHKHNLFFSIESFPIFGAVKT